MEALERLGVEKATAQAVSNSPAISDSRAAYLGSARSLVIVAVALWQQRCQYAQAIKKPIANPIGLLIAILNDPIRYGLAELDGQWRLPADLQMTLARADQASKVAEKGRQQQAAERQKRLSDEAERLKRLADESANYDRENALWYALGEERALIEREAFAGLGLFAVTKRGQSTFEKSVYLRRLCLQEMYRRHPELRTKEA